jgi:hypothetical protein
MESVANDTPRPLYPQERPGTHCIRSWVGPAGVEKLAPTGIRSPDRPGRSASLYRLSYSGPHNTHTQIYIYMCVCVEMVKFSAQNKYLLLFSYNTNTCYISDQGAQPCRWVINTNWLPCHFLSFLNYWQFINISAVYANPLNFHAVHLDALCNIGCVNTLTPNDL